MSLNKDHKNGIYGKQRVPGAAFTEEGRRIMKKAGCYLRYQIRAFNGFSEKVQHDFCKGKEIIFINTIGINF